MDEKVNPALIEKYQLILQQDPASKVFAPLAEGYRKMGLTEEAKKVCLNGLSYHPQFASGRVALGKIYLDLQSPQEAIQQFEKATETAPENILAHKLRADCYLHLRQPKEALKAYKMVLFLNPEDEKAMKAVQKLESLTADEYQEEVFAMKPLKEAAKDTAKKPDHLSPIHQEQTTTSEHRDTFLERYISLADAFIVRNDIDRAKEALDEAERIYGRHAEITQRLQLIRKRQSFTEAQPAQDTTEAIDPPPPSREEQLRDEKIQFLRSLLQRISSYEKSVSPS